MEAGIDSSNPQSLTKNLNFKDTWHVAAGAQYRLDSPWRLNFGVAYDSEFQDGSNVSPMLPANWAWRFGLGAQKQESKTFSWGLAAEYVYGGNLDGTGGRIRPWRWAAAGTWSGRTITSGSCSSLRT